MLLALLFAVALGTRVVGALDYGRGWYAPDSFTHINFDEAGSCRAALGGFSYTPFVGYQTLWLTTLTGTSIAPEQRGLAEPVKAFCHAEAHLKMARLYSAVTGALTVVLLFALVQQLFPARPDLALGSASLLALSGWHMSESLMGTVDAPSTFFIYLFFAIAVWGSPAIRRRWPVAVLALGAALATKYWVFAVLSCAVLVPPGVYPQLLHGISRSRLIALLLAYGLLFGLVSNPQLPAVGQWLLPFAFYLVPPWKQLRYAGRLLLMIAPWLAPVALQIDLFAAFTSGSLVGPFGTDYGAIGWHKLLRNVVNVPIVMLVGLGLPAFVAAGLGVYDLWMRKSFDRVWLVLLPLPGFLLFMAFLAPVTYYRHYLPLLPAACVLAAIGIGGLGHRYRQAAWILVLVWQGALALDLVTDYHLDPRRSLPGWYAQNRPSVVMHGYYVLPPPYTGAVHRLFRESYAAGRGARLRLADTLILSENWYDTAFANELNGPLVNNPGKLIKTRPQAVAFHRAAVAGEHPMLEQAAHFRAPTFMPELLGHRTLYGSFTQFVGDIRIFRVKP